MTEEGKRLIWFHGKECVHCRRLRPTVDQLEAEGVPIVELEVWHNEENAKLMKKYGEAISKACGGELGVPCFYNEKTGKALCGGSLSLEKIRAWTSE